MLGKTYDSEICSAARALEVVGERWTLLIIRKAMFGHARRFGDFLSLGIATNVLQNRLDGLVAADVLRRSGDGRRTEYSLTERGRALQPVLIALTEWGDAWAAPDGPPVRYVHENCGGQVTLHVDCETCGRRADAREVRADPGPGMPLEIAARLRALHAGGAPS